MINRYDKKSYKSRLIISLICFSIPAIIYLLSIHAYLAVHEPIDGKILVVEGWLSDSFLKAAAVEFKNGGYSQLVTVGGPFSDTSNSNNIRTYADRSAERLRKILPYEKRMITAVPAPTASKQKTLAYAISFDDWMHENQPDLKSINVFTAGVHARKSLLIFRKVLAPDVNVGIISAKPLLYNAETWWLSKRGIWLVLKNSISYIDALLFTHYEMTSHRRH